MGWSYVLAITATALAIFCPVLSNYTDIRIKEEGGFKEGGEEEERGEGGGECEGSGVDGWVQRGGWLRGCEDAADLNNDDDYEDIGDVLFEV
jgi:hypothetical protein